MVSRRLHTSLVARATTLFLGVAAAASCSSAAPSRPYAEPNATARHYEATDTFGLGEGRSGALNVTASGTIVNTYAPVVGVNAAATQVTLGSLTGAPQAFAPGDLLVVWRTTGLTSAVTASQAVVALGADVGTYEFGRVKAVAGSLVTFTNRLSSATLYATGSQVVRIPEYTTASLAASASVVPYAWDGSTGGVVIFFATGALTNAGSIVADGAGFRGGPLENAASQIAAPGCTAHDGSDEAAGCGGAHKGEGLYSPAYSPLTTPVGGQLTATYGNGNYVNGAGGGEARNAGGGGGGGFGLGGTGGNTSATDGTRLVGGYGGAPLSYSPSSPVMAFGGGGGSGDEDHGTGTAGGAGGGVVFLRVGSLVGSGALSAQGASVTANAGTDGAGGGGGGGAILVFSNAGVSCGTASANGGTGGAGGSEPDGPGGGGGGGLVYIESSATTCATSASGGVAGLTPLAVPNGATGGASGQFGTSGGAPYGPGACTPSVVGSNQCGGCVDDVDCPTSKVCDGRTNLCGPCNATEQGGCTGVTSACNTTGPTDVCTACNGSFGSSTATAPCLTAALPRCVTSGPGAGTCGTCLTGSDCSAPAAPACSSTTFTCAACNGDMGTTATAACPTTAAPYCQAAGTCGVCTTNADCTGAHAGPNCDTATGACGNTCATNAECASTPGQWCDTLMSTPGICQPQVPNGQAVPGGTCTTSLASSACASGVCSTTDNECGTPNGSPCPGGDAGAGQCRSGVCVSSGANAGTCGNCNADASCSGATPACDQTSSLCVQCTMTNVSACTGLTPVCDMLAELCAGCTGDLGSTADTPCPSSGDPVCLASGECGHCAINSDCEGVGHVGPICNSGTRSCGITCSVATDCSRTQWCSAVDGGSGTCMEKVANGSPLPTAPASVSRCTPAVALEVCASGICDAQDNLCGPATEPDGGPPLGDASVPGQGVSIEGGALSCSAGRAGSPGGAAPACVIGLGLVVVSLGRRSRRRGTSS